MPPPLVLVVDDDRDTRELYKLVYEVGGLRVAEADGCQVGIDTARRLRPDVIVTDWMLGDGDGLRLCEGLRRHGTTRLIPVVAATGMSLGDEVRARARSLGCEAFLLKPIDLDLLVRTTMGAVHVKEGRLLRAAAARIRLEAARAGRRAVQDSGGRGASARELLAAFRPRTARSIALIIADDAGKYVAVNDTAAELTGYEPSVLTTLSVADLTPEPQVTVGRDLWHRFMESGAQEGVFLVKRRDGQAVPLRYVAFANIAPGLHLSALTAE